MNGYPRGRTPYDDGSSNLPLPASSPNNKNSNKAMAGGYRREAPGELNSKDAPRFVPTGLNPAQRTERIDLKDPIQVHLLTETALSDSKAYEILTQEEVDELKKQSQLLSQRLDATRTNLAIQSKYRDAAVSMSRLYGSAQPDDPHAMEAERERHACQRKCDDLAAELFNLEKRLMGPQRRLLEHTAGILQLTHKASKKKVPPPIGQLINGMPGSPESLYTYSLSRSSLDPAADENYMDDPSLYQLDFADGVQASRQPKKNAIEIPMKSPIREQNQLRGEMDRLREENLQLRGQTDTLIKKLRGLNVSLRETIVKFNPEVNSDYLEPPGAAAMQQLKPAELLNSQVGYLESGIVAVQAEQDSFAGGREMGERLEALNLQVRDLLMSSDPHYTPKPIPPESDVPGQLAYLESSLRLADSQLGRSLTRKSDGDTELVLTRLWDSIQSGFAESKKRRDERRRNRGEKALADEDDVSEDEGFDTTEPYSLPALSSRVQWLYAQAMTLKEQKSVLKRQVKQQRELNTKSDTETKEEIGRKEKELAQSRQLLERAEKDAMDAQTMLSTALQDLEVAKGSAGVVDERNAKVDALEAKLRDVQNKLSAAESESKRAGQKLADMDLQVAALTQAKAVAEEVAQNLRKELDENTTSVPDKEKALKDKEDEVEQLSMTLAELKTELTIAQAELDGAYGSRAERAADVAALKNSAEVVKLQKQVDKLKQELGETVQELEGITKETIGAEREKLELEAKLDEALSSKTTLEAEVEKSRVKVSKLQEELDSQRLKVASSQGTGARPGAGASMLSEQFRATMREERKRFQEGLREERTKCRKLEEELNKLKRNQGPGKSPLSPR